MTSGDEGGNNTLWQLLQETQQKYRTKADKISVFPDDHCDNSTTAFKIRAANALNNDNTCCINDGNEQWEPGSVSARTGWGSYIIDTPSGPRRRHFDDIRSRQVNTEDAEATSVEFLHNNNGFEMARSCTSVVVPNRNDYYCRSTIPTRKPIQCPNRRVEKKGCDSIEAKVKGTSSKCLEQ
ncbi:hypothetical protein GJ496_008309 [Pomphorhynchus laevis]|nr:hypothetical protein GJ496_008309 [Pomphorhynchus laevis]